MVEGLTVQIEGGAIVIRLPIDVLPVAWKAGRAEDYVEDPDDPFPEITDPAAFAEDLVIALTEEIDESGNTVLMQAFDDAMTRAVESGAEGVDWEAYLAADEKRTLVQAITLAASGNPDREPTPGDPIGMVEALAADAASLRADVARLWGENERLKESLEARAGWRESQDRINNRVYNGCPKEYARDTVSESIVAWLNGTIEEAASLRARLAECEKERDDAIHDREAMIQWRERAEALERKLAALEKAVAQRESMVRGLAGTILEPEKYVPGWPDLAGVFDEDARYNWPERWGLLRAIHAAAIEALSSSCPAPSTEGVREAGKEWKCHNTLTGQDLWVNPNTEENARAFASAQQDWIVMERTVGEWKRT